MAEDNEKPNAPAGKDELSPSSSPAEEARNNAYFTREAHQDIPAQKQKKKGLPPFLQHLKNPKDVKIWIRCSIALWVATIFMFINPILENYGQATFFGPILLIIAPPSGVVLVGIIGPLTAATGMCVSWAWGVITMKAAQATRSAAERNALLANLAQAIAANADRTPNTDQTSGQSTYSSQLIFDGFALDARAVVVYFVMMGVFVYLVARLRVAAPKLILFQIFAIVVADIFLTIGPLLPTFEGTIPQVLVKPAVSALAIGVVCNIFIFPETTSHVALAGFEHVLGPMKGFLEACLQSFQHHPIQFDVQKLEGTRAAVVGAYKGLEASLGFLELDWSRGRWNTKDISSLTQPLKDVLLAFVGLVQMQISIAEQQHRMEYFTTLRDAMSSKEDDDALPVHGRMQIFHALDMFERLPHDQQSILLSHSMAALAKSSNNILNASMAALDAMIEAIHSVNTTRWFAKTTPQQFEDMRKRHQAILEKLERERLDFARENRDLLFQPHAHLFDDKGRLKPSDDPLSNPIRSLILALVLEELMLNGADALHHMLERIVQLQEHRQKVAFWPPTKLRHAWRWAIGHGSAPSGTSDKYDASDDFRPFMTSREKSKRADRKLAGSDAGSGSSSDSERVLKSAQEELHALRVLGGRQHGKAHRFLVSAIEWFTSTEGLYAFRILVVTIALSLPAVIGSSAGFFYRERGLWGLIMSQTGLVTFSADFIFGLISRIIGTIIGGALGLCAWYIGAGTGPGNPYGMGAITAVFVLILMYCRLNAPPQFLQGLMLAGASFFLVIGYSWDDTHIPSYGNPGVGYSVFWRRLLLVIVGFTAATIVTFFPKPPSATRNIANTMADSLRSSKDHLALLLVSWSSPQKDLGSVIQKAVIGNSETLNALPPRIALLKFEFTTTNFDAAALTKVRKLCQAVNISIATLFTYVVGLPPELKSRFAKTSGMTDERLVADLMAVISLLEQALKTGDPLPAILPAPLLLRAVEYGQSRSALRGGSGSDGDPYDGVTTTMIRQPTFRQYCVVVDAFTKLLMSVDELAFVLKGTLGEEHVVADFESNLWLRHGEQA